MMADHQGALTPIAGATDVLVHWPLRQDAHDRAYIDLSALRELRQTSWKPDRLELGALVTYWDTLNDERTQRVFPVLVLAARQVGAIQIQSRGTWAGNIANGSPAADGVPALMSYDAVVTLTSSSGQRAVALNDFYLGYRKSVKRPDELITSISIPRGAYDFGVFHKVGPRRAQAITKVGVAITHRSDSPADAWRVVANSVAPTVRRCRSVEARLSSGPAITSPAALLPSLQNDVAPIDDIRSTAEYRRTVLSRLIYHALAGVCPNVI